MITYYDCQFDHVEMRQVVNGTASPWLIESKQTAHALTTREARKRAIKGGRVAAWVLFGITAFTLWLPPRVTLGITAKEVDILTLLYFYSLHAVN